MYIRIKENYLYICFVDLQKAFDSVWRNRLLFKLVKICVGKQLCIMYIMDLTN